MAFEEFEHVPKKKKVATEWIIFAGWKGNDQKYYK